MTSLAGLRAALAASRQEIDRAREGLPDTALVYPDSGWRVRDVLVHIAAWEDEAAKSLGAFSRGGGYRIPNFTSEDAFNAATQREWARASDAEAHQEYAEARQRFLDAIAALDGRLDEKGLVYPWGARGTPAHLVRDMAGHEREHATQVARTRG